MERRCLRSVVAVAAIICLVGAGEPQAPAARKDPQASFEPRLSPGAGQKYLEAFVGEWDVVKTFYPRSGGEPSRTLGTCRQTMIHDGRFLQSEFVFEQGGRKTTGLGLIGFESQSGKFTTVWTDSRQTRMSIRQSREPFNGKEIVLVSHSLEEDGKGMPASRTVSRIEDDHRKIIHRQFTTGPDGKERVIMELAMTRKAKTP
jgi:Protein of unknown function (DUF1579)